MPIAKVNGVEVEFEPGMTVLQVAELRRGGDPALLLPRAAVASPATAACAWSR